MPKIKKQRTEMCPLTFLRRNEPADRPLLTTVLAIGAPNLSLQPLGLLMPVRLALMCRPRGGGTRPTRLQPCGGCCLGTRPSANRRGCRRCSSSANRYGAGAR